MRTVESSIFIQAPPAKVLDAFTEAELLRGWWGVERALVEKFPGGTYALVWGVSEKGFQYVNCGVVHRYEAGKLLEIHHFCYFNPDKDIMGGMRLNIVLQGQDEGTLLKLFQDGYQSGGDWDWLYQAVVEAWPRVLTQLKEFLEQK